MIWDACFRKGYGVGSVEAGARVGGQFVRDGANIAMPERWSGEGFRRVAGWCGRHDVGPDRQGQGSAVSAVDDGFRLIEPHPHSAREAARVTYEPGINIIIGCSGFPGARL